MIYQGTDANTIGAGTQIGTSSFNTNYNDNAYVGYMYGTLGSNTYEATHTNTNDSTIKVTLDNWYSSTSGLESYLQYIDTNAGFCNDREVLNTTAGFGSNWTSYISENRLTSNGGQNPETLPVFKCNQVNDLFTTAESNSGNKALKYPIGLITADEIIYAGGIIAGINTSFYLQTNQYYWTITPRSFGNALIPSLYNAASFAMSNDNGIVSPRTDSVYGIRPVINLKPDVSLSGSGTTTDPYKVEGS